MSSGERLCLRPARGGCYACSRHMFACSPARCSKRGMAIRGCHQGHQSTACCYVRVPCRYGCAPSSNTPQGRAAEARRASLIAAVAASDRSSSSGENSSGEEETAEELGGSQQGKGARLNRKLRRAAAAAAAAAAGIAGSKGAGQSGCKQAQGSGLINPSAATRAHGQVYGACEKCERILGTMLCAATPAPGGLV